MNSKFNKLKYLIQELINNNPNLIIPDNVSFLESEVIPTIPIILYAHDFLFDGNLLNYESDLDELCTPIAWLAVIMELVRLANL